MMSSKLYPSLSPTCNTGHPCKNTRAFWEYTLWEQPWYMGEELQDELLGMRVILQLSLLLVLPPPDPGILLAFHSLNHSLSHASQAVGTQGNLTPHPS